MQLAIIALVLLAVGGVALAQASAQFQRSESRRTLGVAELAANNPLVRTRLEQFSDLGFGADITDLATVAAAISTQGKSMVMITDAEGNVLASTVGLQSAGHGIQPRVLRDGASWSGLVDLAGSARMTAQVPVYSDDSDRLGTVVGAVAVLTRVPAATELLADASGYLLAYTALACVLSGGGAWLVARRIKRQTLGLEPREIAALADYREAILRGIAEGVIALDTQHRITMINDIGRELLELPGAAVGTPVESLDVSERLAGVLTGPGNALDEIVLRRGRVLIMNRMAVSKDGRELGSVTTLRDRTELVDLERKVGAFRSTTDLLRAQAHEFDNRLHIIGGLVQLNEFDQVVRYIDTLRDQRADLDLRMTERIRDTTVAALLLAKVSTAAENRVELRIDESSELEPLTPQDAADLATVLGNLIDNGVDAASDGSQPAWVRVKVTKNDAMVEVTVADSGPGVGPDLATEVFRNGFSTKAAHAGDRGIGLALTRRLCRQRDGEVQIAGSGHDARFVARLAVSSS